MCIHIYLIFKTRGNSRTKKKKDFQEQNTVQPLLFYTIYTYISMTINEYCYDC